MAAPAAGAGGDVAAPGDAAAAAAVPAAHAAEPAAGAGAGDEPAAARGTAGSPAPTVVHDSDTELDSDEDDAPGAAAVGAGSGDDADGVDVAPVAAPSAGSVLAPRRPDSRAYAQDRFGAAASVASVSAWLLTTTVSVAERGVIQAFAAVAHSGASVLLLFSGPAGREDGLAAQLRAAGARVLEVDVLIGERLHDLTRVGPDSIGDHLLRVARGGEFTAMHAAIPCSTFSVVRSAADTLRSAQYPLGIPGLTFANASKVWLSNALVYYTIDMARHIVGCGGEVFIENPAPRGDPSLPKVYWEAKAGHASLFRTPPMLTYAAATHSVELITPLCAFGMAMQKYVCVLATPRMAARLAHIGAMECTHTEHERHASGLLPDGSSAAEASARYPAAFCAALVPGLTLLPTGAHAAALSVCVGAAGVRGACVPEVAMPTSTRPRDTTCQVRRWGLGLRR